MQRIDFIAVLPHQSWVCYVINSFCNDLLWGSEEPGGDQPLLQPSVLCLIGFMVCLNWSSPEDNRSLQCFKLNYRCCKVCSESVCTRGLFPPQQFIQARCVCAPHSLCVSGMGNFQPCPCSPAVPCGCSCSQNFQGDLGSPILQLLQGPCVPELQSAEMSVPPFKNLLHFLILRKQSLFLQGPCAGSHSAVQSPRASRRDSRSCVSLCLALPGSLWLLAQQGKELLRCPALPKPLCMGTTCSLGNLAAQICLDGRLTLLLGG